MIHPRKGTRLDPWEKVGPPSPSAKPSEATHGPLDHLTEPSKERVFNIKKDEEKLKTGSAILVKTWSDFLIFEKS